MKVDVFISHASEDKDTFVRPLAAKLANMEFEVWYDEFSLKVGDSLTQSIDSGLACCRHAIVVLSPAFLRKNWPRWELNGIVQRHVDNGGKFIIPIWHQVSVREVADVSPSLADIVALRSDEGVDSLALLIGELLSSGRNLQDLRDKQEVQKIQAKCDFQWKRALESFAKRAEAVQSRSLASIQGLSGELNESLSLLLRCVGPFVLRDESFIGIKEFYSSGSFVTYDSLAPLWTAYTIRNMITGRELDAHDPNSDFGRYLIYESDDPVEEWSSACFGGLNVLWGGETRLQGKLLSAFSLESLVDDRSGCSRCSTPLMPHFFHFHQGRMLNVHPYMILGYCPNCDTPDEDFRCVRCGIRHPEWVARIIYEMRRSALWELTCPKCRGVVAVADNQTPWKDWHKVL